MTNVKETPITTLKAEVVNDIEILKKGHSYPTDFECEIAVKVGNKVENLTWEFGRDYRSSNSTPIAHMDNRSKEKFDGLIQAGIAIDYSDVVKDYLSAIEVCKEQIEKDKKEAIKKRKIANAKFYDSSWVPAFIENVKGDKRFETKDFEFKLMDRQKYIDGDDELFVTLIYRGISGNFKNSDFTINIAHSFRGKLEKRFNVYNGYKLHEDGRYETVMVTDDKTRKGKLGKSVVHRWFQDVDEYLAIIESKKNRANKEKEDRQELMKLLKEKSGKSIEGNNEYVYREDRRGGSYYAWKYYIKLTPIGEKEEKEFRVSFNDYQKVYSIDGLSGLNEFQFKSIIEILEKKVQ